MGKIMHPTFGAGIQTHHLLITWPYAFSYNH